MEIFINRILPAEILLIHYIYSKNIFGNFLLAATDKGICYAAFDDDQHTAFAELKNIFPNAVFLNQSNHFIENAQSVIAGLTRYSQMQSVIAGLTRNPQKERTYQEIAGQARNDGAFFLHIKGTDFQMEVWEELLKIPFGETTTYGAIAQKIHKPKASRAVGSAIGANPVSFFVPCHRVLQSTGKIGGYHWGVQRKKAILDWEKNYGK